MSDPIDFEFHRFEKLTAGYAESLRRNLEQLQSTDVSKFNGRELRKLRDRMLNIKWLILACDPKTREQIQANMDRNHKSAGRLTLDEIGAFVPEPPTVRFL